MSNFWLDRLRERINIFLFPHKEILLWVLRILSVVVSFVAVYAIVYYHGFPRTPRTDEIVRIITRLSLAFYALKYFLNFFYDFHPLAYLKRTWFEGILVLFIILMWFFYLIVGQQRIYAFFAQRGMEQFTNISILFIQFYVFIMVLVETAKASQYIDKIKIGPAGLLALSFLILIAFGTIMLLLPEMTTGHHIQFVDALFLSTSASCVTGLSPVEISDYLSLKGQVVILILIQLGGINIISFATFIALFYTGAEGLKQQSLLKDLLDTSGLSDARRILKRIVLYSFTIEIIGSVILYLLWEKDLSITSAGGLGFAALFHSVSSFNNAGFSIFPNGLMYEPVRMNLASHWIIAILIVLGGIGFSVLQEILDFKLLLTRIRTAWKRFQVQTKIVLITTFFLIILGALGIFLLEYNHSFQGLKLSDKITTAFFQSITARTAGFNTVNIGALSQTTLFLLIILMFIGASPGGTGGGIKTTTFLTLIKASIATIRGKKRLEAFKHTISFETVDKAYSVALLSLLLIVTGTFILTILQPDFTFTSILFEVVSAFGTVGLTMGITPLLGSAGKLVVIVTMYVGRVGTLTLAIAFLKKASFKDYVYPKANIMIG
jgi:potassium uptake TrkH family protein